MIALPALQFRLDLHAADVDRCEPHVEGVAEVIVGIATNLTMIDLAPGTRLELPDFEVLSRTTRRSWAAHFRGMADRFDPGPSPDEVLEDLRTCRDDWDDEGAPRPDSTAIDRAVAILKWADAEGLVVYDVDADVRGGVSIILQAEHRRAWIACMNGGDDTTVMSVRGQVRDHCMFSLGSVDGRERVLGFLRSSADGEAERH